MKKLIQNISDFEFFVFWCMVLVNALAWSKFLLSISIWALVIIAIFQIPRHFGAKLSLFHWIIEYLQFWHWQIRSDFFYKLKSFWRHPAFVAVTISFFLVLVSGFWSSNFSYFLTRVRLKIPLLLLPIVFYTMPPLSKRQFWSIWYVFFYSFVVLSAYHVVYYFTHFEASNIGLGQGIPIKSLKSHIVFTSSTAFAVIVGLELWTRDFYLKYKRERVFILISTVFLIVALHIFSVRTGILILYICLFIKTLEFIFQRKQLLLGIIALGFITIIPIIAYNFAPSFKQRVNYAIWDFQQYKEGNTEDKSDSGRIISLKMGFEVVKNNPIIGVGFGDIMNEVSAAYATKYPDERPREPHSYWLFTAVGVGIVGLAIWLAAILTPVFYQKAYQNGLFMYFNTVFIIANTVDYIFEGAIYSAFYAFATGLFLNYFKNKNTHDAL